MELLKPLYGLCELGDLWHTTIDNYHRVDLNMKPSRSDPAFYISFTDSGDVRGFSGNYVDDMLRARNDEFRHISAATAKKFRLGENQHLPCEFSGFHLDKLDDGTMRIKQ